jgi:hypothetical protein
MTLTGARTGARCAGGALAHAARVRIEQQLAQEPDSAAKRVITRPPR